MGFNRRKMADQLRQAVEKDAATGALRRRLAPRSSCAIGFSGYAAQRAEQSKRSTAHARPSPRGCGDQPHPSVFAGAVTARTHFR
jgi:hypothetical protein